MTPFFIIMNSSPLYRLHYVGMLVYIHAIRCSHFSLVRWNSDVSFPAPDIACLFDWIERGCIFFSYYWCHMPVTLSLPSFNLFQTFAVDGRNVNWMQWKNGWIILFWYYGCWACCNILDARFCSLYVVLQWEYKLCAVLLELHNTLSF